MEYALLIVVVVTRKAQCNRLEFKSGFGNSISKISFAMNTTACSARSLHTFGRGTEAQMRAALHAHILVWFLPREEKPDYVPLEPIDRQAVGTKPCQRPRHQKVLPLPKYQEDNCYHRVQMGRVMTEMVRPSTAGKGHGGFNDYMKLRMAGLARAIQTKLYLHKCSKKYCLQNRNTCRFFFPLRHRICSGSRRQMWKPTAYLQASHTLPSSSPAQHWQMRLCSCRQNSASISAHFSSKETDPSASSMGSRLVDSGGVQLNFHTTASSSRTSGGE